MSQENPKITAKAKEFDQELEKFMRKYADKLNHEEAYQAVVMMLARSMGAYIAHQQKGGKTKEEVVEIMRQIVSQKWNNPGVPLKLH